MNNVMLSVATILNSTSSTKRNTLVVERSPEISISFFLNLFSHIPYGFLESRPRFFRRTLKGQWFNQR